MPPKKGKKGKRSPSRKRKGKDKKTEPSVEEVKPGHPDDILPLVLTSVTQDLFGCVADENVTGESPYKLLKKDDIIQDIKTRAAVSDFSPMKQTVLDYPEDEMLLVFDSDFTYGQCFYMVLTPEAKDRILNPPQPETQETSDDEIIKTPEPKEWVSLGSEREVDEESVKESKKMSYRFSRVRRKFGEPVCFSDRNAADVRDGLVECVSYQDSRFNIRLMQRDCGMQAIPKVDSSSSQTQRKTMRNTFTQYMPKELSDEEKDSILQKETLKNFCNSAFPRVLLALQQEAIMNVFDADWKALGTGAENIDWSGKVSEDLTLFRAFANQTYSKDKTVSSISWHPTIHGMVAVALRDKKENNLNDSGTLAHRPSLILFYSFSDPCEPQLLLECPDDILAFEFCPCDPNIIVGGCINGQVVLWDISAQATHLQESDKKVSADTEKFDLDDNEENKTPVVRFCAVSALESRHKAPITDVHWLPPTFEVTRTGIPLQNKYNTCVQVVTCSLDCTLMFWDLRLQKGSSHLMSDNKQRVDQKTQVIPHSVSNVFKYLDQTWNPFFTVSLPKIDTSGEYTPLKFCLEHYTCNERAKEGDDTSEVISDYSQMRIPSADTIPVLDDISTKLYIGTEDGEIVYTDWKLEKDDSGQLQSSKPLHCFNVHHWLVNTVQRSPFLKDIILTAGDSNFAIWKDDVMEGPIFLSPHSEQVCTAACWSLSRPAVFFIGKENGSIDVWNLLEKTSEPTHVQEHITNGRITYVKSWMLSSKQHYLAVTDDVGMVRVFEIPKAFYFPSRNESLSVKKYFELEEDRLKNLLMKEEMWEKEKKEAEQSKKMTTTADPKKGKIIVEENEEANMKEYSDHLALEKSILKEIGMLPATADTQDI